MTGRHTKLPTTGAGLPFIIWMWLDMFTPNQPREQNRLQRLTMIVSAPVADNQNSLTTGPRGPVRLLIWYLFIVPARKWDHPIK